LGLFVVKSGLCKVRKIKLNYEVRIKNLWFWVGVVSVALTAIGVDPQIFTSWRSVLDGLLAVLLNPVQLVTVILSILSVFIDPTTNGLFDSQRRYSIKKL